MKTNNTIANSLSNRTARSAAILAAAFFSALLPASQVHGYAFKEDNIVSDASWIGSGTEQPGWQSRSFDDSSWASVVTLPYVPLADYVVGSQAYPYPPTIFIPGTTGKHIWDPGLDTVSPAYFRKRFTVYGIPGFLSTVAKVRVDDAYEFYINGNLVGSKITTLPSDAQEYDISGFVRRGENVFAIKAWNIESIPRAVLVDARIFSLVSYNPVADAGAPQWVKLGAKVNLNGEATSDSETPQDELGCKWTIESAPAGSSAALIDGHTLYPELVPDRIGIYKLKLMVLDSEGLEDSAETTVTVDPMLTNGSFESDFADWSVEGNVRIQTSPPASNGKKHAGFNAGNSKANGVLTQLFETIPGQTYQVSFDLGTLSYNNAEQVLQVYMGNAFGPYGVQPRGIPNFTQLFTTKGLGNGKTVWETKSFFFTPAGVSASLKFSDISTTSGSIDLLLDNIKITPVFPLLNGSFESNFDGWSVKGNVVIKDSPPYIPIHGRKMAAFNTANTQANGILSQTFATIPGKTYLLSFDMGVLAYNTNEQRLQIALTGIPNAVFFTVKGLGGGKTRWEAQRLSFTADSPVTTVTFLDSSTANDSIDLLLDHVKVELTSILSDGSFEGAVGDYFLGWGSSGNVRIQTVPKASDGIKHAGFNAGDSANNGELSQSFVTQPGVTYPLSFDMGVLAYNTNAQRLQVEVEGLAKMNQTFTMNGLGGGKARWEPKNWFFIADSEYTRITFRDVSVATVGIDLLLDNVRVAPTPADLSLIPAGSFQMGDSLDGDAAALPVHTVDIRAFYMAKQEVSKALWDEVRTWATGHGYTDLPAGEGKASDHPVQAITWLDVIKWCNARSEKEGLVACYSVSGAIFRNGSGTPVCNWAATGYRLPTEAEWEKAARGALNERRFPWGDIINHSQANYYSIASSYDVSPTQDFHPLYEVGAVPYTSPLGSFPANRYGLSDVTGNPWEWCWDKYEPYSAASQTDPRGPLSAGLGDRVVRGGSWNDEAYFCRVAFRLSSLPTAFGNFGFRTARSSLR